MTWLTRISEESAKQTQRAAANCQSRVVGTNDISLVGLITTSRPHKGGYQNVFWLSSCLKGRNFELAINLILLTRRLRLLTFQTPYCCRFAEVYFANWPDKHIPDVWACNFTLTTWKVFFRSDEWQMEARDIFPEDENSLLHKKMSLLQLQFQVKEKRRGTSLQWGSVIVRTYMDPPTSIKRAFRLCFPPPMHQ